MVNMNPSKPRNRANVDDDSQKLRDTEFKMLLRRLEESWKANDMNSVAIAASQVAFMADRPGEWLRQHRAEGLELKGR